MSFLRVAPPCRAIRRRPLTLLARAPSAYSGARLSSTTSPTGDSDDAPKKPSESGADAQKDPSEEVSQRAADAAADASTDASTSTTDASASASSTDASPSPPRSLPTGYSLLPLSSPPAPPPTKPYRLRTDLDLSHLTTFPSLQHADPILDSALTYHAPRSAIQPYPTTVTIHNAIRVFYPLSADQMREVEGDGGPAWAPKDHLEEAGLPDLEPGEMGLDDGEEEVLDNEAAMELSERAEEDEEDPEAEERYNTVEEALHSMPRGTPTAKTHTKLHHYPLIKKRVMLQTGKGKISSIYALAVVGDGDGLVGYGEGKAFSPAGAFAVAYRSALRAMDRVERFERRTIWEEVELKFGACRVVLRPRPIGFGLRCGPMIHQVCKAAGIKDVSAEIYGSRNQMNVIKATCLALWGGEARPGMGDGLGGGGRRVEKGYGARGRDEVERARGRRLLIL